MNLVSAIQRNAAGAVTAQTYGNGVTEAKAYNTDGTPVSQTDTAPSGGGGDADVPTLPEWAAMLMGLVLLTIGYRHQHRSNHGGKLLNLLVLGLTVLLVLPLALPSDAWADEALTYDANGNVQSRTLPGGTTTYGYDALDRVNSEAGPAKTQSLTYDGNDNRLSDGSGSKTYTPNTDRIVTENGQSISLDAAGNVTAARGYVYTWNQAGQLKTVSQGATLLATYTYDYKGRRRIKTTTAAAPQGAQTVLYHYDVSDHLLAETTAAGSPIYTYVWRDDTPVSIIVAGSPETALYLETDHLGTPIAARDQSGKVVWKWESDAFGTTAANEDPDADGKKVTINLRFPGQYFDKESGLFYNWHRYYDPKLGRYMSPDPIGLAGGRNLMAYVNGNPLSSIDPFGEETTIRFIEGATKAKVSPFNAVVELDINGAVTKFDGNTWPDRTQPSPGIESGTYSGVYRRAAHKGGDGIILENNRAIPTIGPNPVQDDNWYADFVHVHAGGESTQRGSAGCLTIKKSQAKLFFKTLRNGGDRNMEVQVIRRDFN